ncbi:hypothetical protein H0H93_016443 [Arthromyces matolae]|nr:hypothetical protein H0H93_016443 [Arthromyces matolae]
MITEAGRDQMKDSLRRARQMERTTEDPREDERVSTIPNAERDLLKNDNAPKEPPASSLVAERPGAQASPTFRLKLPPLTSSDAALDRFVLDSAAIYASMTVTKNVGGPRVTNPEQKSFCRYLLRQLLKSRRYERCLSLHGEDMKTLIDSIQNLLDLNVADSQFRAILIVVLLRLASVSEVYPKRITLQNVVREDGPLIKGKFGFIGKGSSEGKTICIKVLRLATDLNPRLFHQILLRQTVLWAQIHHENLLPFYGLCRLSNGHLGFVTPHLANGNVVEFLHVNPDADRLSLMLDAATGLVFLHETGIIHGCINGRNILVMSTSPPSACLSDFGLRNITDLHALRSSDTSSAPHGPGAKHFLAPELLSESAGFQFLRRNEATDVYALSMACYQILTGDLPFRNKYDYAVVRAVLKGERPRRPVEDIYVNRGLSNCLWKTMENTWTHDALMRPSSRHVRAKILKQKKKHEFERALSEIQQRLATSLAHIFNNIKCYKSLLCLNEKEAQVVLDTFQSLLDTEQFRDRVQLIAAMRRLSERTKRYPLCFLLNGPVPQIGDDPIASGNYADIYKIPFHGEDTCFKVIRVYQRSLIEHMAKVYAREVIVWGQLSHPNILPFYGLCTFRSRLSFVAPWAENGHLSEYLAKNPKANRTLLCLDTACGIEYLHANEIVHGDLKGTKVNVLVERSGRACLGDFGLSSVTDPEIIHWTSQSSVASHGGTARWQAPELHETEENVERIHNSKQSDVFAWANLCYEVVFQFIPASYRNVNAVAQIFTGRLPFFEAVRESTVIMTILRGGLPTRPRDDDPAWLERGLNECIWDLLKECWRFDPSERPDIGTIISRLSVDKPLDDRPPGEWEARASTRFRNAQERGSSTNIIPSLTELDGILSQLIVEAEQSVKTCSTPVDV